MSLCMTQISLSIRPVWSESSLCAQWIAKDPWFPQADSEDSDQTGRMPRLIWVFSGRTVNMLVLSWGGSLSLLRLISTFLNYGLNLKRKREKKTRLSLNKSTFCAHTCRYIWAPSSEFVSSSIPSWQILTAHAKPFRGARDLAFCLKVPLDSLLVWASSGGSGETARMRRLAWTFAARIGDKYQIRLTQSI